MPPDFYAITPEYIKSINEQQKLVAELKKGSWPVPTRRQNLRKLGTIFGMDIMLDMTDVAEDERDDKYYETRKAFEVVVGINTVAKSGSKET